MLFIPPPKFRKRRGRKKKSDQGSPSMVGPVLVAASFDSVGRWVQLQFNEAVDPGGVDPSQIAVNDGPGNTHWVTNGGITIVNAMTIRLSLDHPDTSTEPGVHLYATATNGIVSSEDGEMWAGVSDLELPFP